MWVNKYLIEVHGEAQVLEIIADIDHQQVFSYLLHALTNPIYIESLQYLHFPDCATFQMVEISNSGQAMIRRHL
jgi:hypothetical protein